MTIKSVCCNVDKVGECQSNSQSTQVLLRGKHVFLLFIVALPLINFEDSLLVVFEPDGGRFSILRIPETHNIKLRLDLIVETLT